MFVWSLGRCKKCCGNSERSYTEEKMETAKAPFRDDLEASRLMNYRLLSVIVAFYVGPLAFPDILSSLKGLPSGSMVVFWSIVWESPFLTGLPKVRGLSLLFYFTTDICNETGLVKANAQRILQSYSAVLAAHVGVAVPYDVKYLKAPPKASKSPYFRNSP